MNRNQNTLTESVDALIREYRAEQPFRRYLRTKAGLRDMAIGASLAGLCFVAAYFVVQMNQ